MKIKTIIEQADGSYEFNAVLTPDQHSFLIEFAIKELIRVGLIPFAQAATELEKASLIPAIKSEQLH